MVPIGTYGPRCRICYSIAILRNTPFPAVCRPAVIAIGLLLVFVAGAFSELRFLSATNDEPTHIAAGMSYFVTHETYRANPEHPPLIKEIAALSLMAAGWHWPRTPEADYLVHGTDGRRVLEMIEPVGRQILAEKGPERALFWARAPMVLIGALLGCGIFLCARNWFGDAAAIGAVFVFAFDPIIFAHTQFVTTDVGVAAFTILSLYGLWRYVCRPSWILLVATGLALGAALASKFSAALLLPIDAVLLLCAVRWPAAGADPESPRPRFSYRSAAAAFPAICAVAAVVVWATYFFQPDPTLYTSGAALVNLNDGNIQRYLFGSLRTSFPQYLAVAYLVKEPIAAIALTAIGFLVLMRRRSIPALVRIFVLLPAAVFFTATSAFAGDMGVRYVIPVLAFGHILAGVAIAALWQQARRSLAARVAAVVLCGWLIVAFAGIYPDHLAYFNEAACLLTDPAKIGFDGGSRCGVDWLDNSNTDWGQAFLELRSWLARNAPNRIAKVTDIAAFPPDQLGIRCERYDIDRVMQPPQPGLYVISAHYVARANASGIAENWLQFTHPTAIVGHALYVYDIR